MDNIVNVQLVQKRVTILETQLATDVDMARDEENSL